MSKSEGFLWECECGTIEYGENPPEDCNQCSAVRSFTEVPEDLVKEKEAENILSQRSDKETEEED